MDQDCSNVNSLWMARKSGCRILMQSNILSFNKLMYVKQGFCHYVSLSYMFAGDEMVSAVNSKRFYVSQVHTPLHIFLVMKEFTLYLCLKCLEDVVCCL